MSVCDDYVVCVTYSGLAAAFQLVQTSRRYAEAHPDAACSYAPSAKASAALLSDVTKSIAEGWAVPAAALPSGNRDTAAGSHTGGDESGGILWPHVFLNLLPSHEVQTVHYARDAEPPCLVLCATVDRHHIEAYAIPMHALPGGEWARLRFTNQLIAFFNILTPRALLLLLV